MSDNLNKPAPAALYYTPGVFDTASIDAAKAIILTPEDLGTEIRWQRETPYLGERIANMLPLEPGSLIIDFGCGIGRIAKELLARLPEVFVMGIDISHSMRKLALDYTDSPFFSALAPEFADRWAARGGQAEAAIAIWVLQHCPHLDEEVDRIASYLAPSGLFVLVNLKTRSIPTNLGWVNDLQSVDDALLRHFYRLGRWDLDPSYVTQHNLASDIQLFQKK